MKDITTASQLKEVTSKPAALIKFTATWCGPCKAVAPQVDKLAAKFPAVECAAVDIDKAQDLARDFGVSAVPTFIFFKNGKPVETIKGADIRSVNAAFSKYGSGDASAIPKTGGNVLGGEGVAAKPVTGNPLVDWVLLYVKSLFSLDARSAA